MSRLCYSPFTFVNDYSILGAINGIFANEALVKMDDHL
jgi:hypothetical protein